MLKEYKDDWNNALQLIKLENDLIHHRTTAALAVHGFLFAAFCAVAIKINEKPTDSWNSLLVAIEFIIPVIGIYASYLLRSGMRAALRQIRACDVWFKKVIDNGPNQGFTASDYPPLTGRRHIDDYKEFTPEERKRIRDISVLCVGMDRLPNAMSLVWAIMLALLTATSCIRQASPYSLAIVTLTLLLIASLANYYFEFEKRMSNPKGTKESDKSCFAIPSDNSREITKKWVRLVAACKLEKQWTNERLGWFFAANGVLLGALGAIVKLHYEHITSSNTPLHLVDQLKTDHVIGIIIVIGIVSSISTFITVLSAAMMHHTWFGEMAKLIDNCQDESLSNSFTFGRTGRKCSWFARWTPVSIPTLMLLVWLSIANKVHLVDIVKSYFL